MRVSSVIPFNYSQGNEKKFTMQGQMLCFRISALHDERKPVIINLILIILYDFDFSLTAAPFSSQVEIEIGFNATSKAMFVSRNNERQYILHTDFH
jgi:hypothetical protein